MFFHQVIQTNNMLKLMIDNDRKAKNRDACKMICYFANSTLKKLSAEGTLPRL